jgi:quercetin dioxygenase-like cupin family protein
MKIHETKTWRKKTNRVFLRFNFYWLGFRMSFKNLDSIEAMELVPGFRAKFIHSDNMTFAYWNIEAGAELPEHSHPHEQVANPLEGEFELTVNGDSRVIRPGDVVVIPGNAAHSGKAITDCRILDVFHPVREDYLNR